MKGWDEIEASTLEVKTLDGEHIERYAHIDELLDDWQLYLEDGDSVSVIWYEDRPVGSINTYGNRVVIVLAGIVTVRVST